MSFEYLFFLHPDSYSVNSFILQILIQTKARQGECGSKDR